MSSVLKDVYSKCLAQESDISKQLSKIMTYPIDTIGRVKQKIEDSLENFENSINLLNISINKSDNKNEDKIYWKKKAELLESSHKNFHKRLKESIYNIRKSQQIKDYKLFKDNDSNLEFGRNINNLEREKESWKNVYKLSTEMEAQSNNINKELDSQIFSMGKIGDKLNNIFDKMTGSFKDSVWIKQRGVNDKYICLFLGFLTIFIILFTYFYLRPKLRKYLFG